MKALANVYIVVLSIVVFSLVARLGAQQTAAGAPAPLTHAEQQDLTVLSLKAQLATAAQQISALKADIGACHAQLGPAQFEQNRQALTAEQAALKAQIEAARPGWSWDPQTGAFTPKKKE